MIITPPTIFENLPREHYNKALKIYIEYGDRYNQASTYYHLAQVAESTGDLDSAKTGYLKDLEITIEFNDEHGLGISLQNAARFYRDHPDDGFYPKLPNGSALKPQN